MGIASGERVGWESGYGTAARVGVGSAIEGCLTAE